jgi:CubicO group peptidase (beta-lactamase class C family)
MRRRSRPGTRLYLTTVSCVAALLIVVYLWHDTSARTETSHAIDAIVESAMKEGGITGASVGVMQSGHVIHSRGYGLRDVENELPATANTVYAIGSITKQFTAAAILRLVEQGEIGLEDPITNYIPGYPNGDEITVRSLLNHTSGIPNYTMIEDWWKTMTVEMQPEEVIRIFRDEPLDFTPGTRFSYSNSGYFLLGYIVEQVTGERFGGYLNEAFFQPLDLESTRYCDNSVLIPDRARGYKRRGGSLVNAAYVSTSQAYAAGAVCSNVSDLLRWLRALSGGIAVEAESYERMSSPGHLVDGTPIEYGYGLAVSHLDGHRRVTHVGGTLGFASFISFYEDDSLAIVVLTNTEDAQAANIESDIARLLFGLEKERIDDILLTPPEMASYTGTYDLGPTRVTVLAGSEGRLEVEVPLPGLEGQYVLLYQGDDRFLAASDSEISVGFEVTNGTADGFTLVRKGITMHAMMVPDESGAL